MFMEFTGKEVADAIRAACAHFQAEREQLRIEVLETGSNGIFGLIRKKARIRAAQRQEVAAPVKAVVLVEDVAAADAPPLETAETVSQASQAAVCEIASEMLRLMAMPSTVTGTVNGLVVTCLIAGPFEEKLVGQDGRVIDSIQYIVQKIAARRCPESLRIVVNVGDFRERRLEKLRATALRLAEEVRVSGKTRFVSALNPAERREIHLLLRDDPDVRSRSVGDGVFKRVLLFKTERRLAGKIGTTRRPPQNGDRSEAPVNSPADSG